MNDTLIELAKCFLTAHDKRGKQCSDKDPHYLSRAVGEACPGIDPRMADLIFRMLHRPNDLFTSWASDTLAEEPDGIAPEVPAERYHINYLQIARGRCYFDSNEVSTQKEAEVLVTNYLNSNDDVSVEVIKGRKLYLKATKKRVVHEYVLEEANNYKGDCND